MKYLAGALFALLLLPAAPASAHEFYFGADLSFANEMDDCGALYREKGKPKDVFALFKEHGANLARIRIWNDGNPTKYSNLADVERGLRRAKALGMTTLLDFHYSDWWADGDKQIIPAAWASIKDDSELANVLYKYTFDTLMALDKAGLMPDQVQVGNEINREILDKGPAKNLPINWKRNALLINAAIKAVRDAGAQSKTQPEVMIQIAQPENNLIWFEAAKEAGITDFDIIGISYYGKWSNYSMSGLGTAINLLRNRYPRAKVMLVETAYPHALGPKSGPGFALASDNVVPGYPATPKGQAKYMVDISQTVISNGGIGVVYWAPDWIPSQCRKPKGRGPDWEVMTFFTKKGEVMPAIDSMRHRYLWPVPVTFRFHAPAAVPGQAFNLWGDFLGVRGFMAVPLRNEDGNLMFRTALMPGQRIRFQVYGDPALQTPLLSGKKDFDGFISNVIPGRETTIDDTLGSVAQ